MSESGIWREQWDRVARWFSRLQETNTGRAHNLATDFYQDELYAFFQNCHHLKDWLKNDASTAAAVADVEDFITKTPSLRLCADLANGSKHLRLDRPRGDSTTKIGGRHSDLTLGGQQDAVITVKYAVEAGGATHDAFTAQGCCDEWRAYLTDKGLL